MKSLIVLGICVAAALALPAPDQQQQLQEQARRRMQRLTLQIVDDRDDDNDKRRQDRDDDDDEYDGKRNDVRLDRRDRRGRRGDDGRDRRTTDKREQRDDVKQDRRDDVKQDNDVKRDRHDDVKGDKRNDNKRVDDRWEQSNDEGRDRRDEEDTHDNKADVVQEKKPDGDVEIQTALRTSELGFLARQMEQLITKFGVTGLGEILQAVYVALDKKDYYNNKGAYPRAHNYNKHYDREYSYRPRAASYVYDPYYMPHDNGLMPPNPKHTYRQPDDDDDDQEDSFTK